MLINTDDLDITCAQSHPGEFEWVASAVVEADLTPVMPYINAVIKKPDDHPDLPAIIWRHEGRRVAVRPHEIALDDVPDAETGRDELRSVVAWINDLWERRDGITPEPERKTPPPLLSVLRMLPMTNCGECGLPTCTAFAAGLINREKQIEECPALEAGKVDSLRDMGLS